MSADVVGLALALLGLIVLLGKLIRVRSKIAQKLFLPASILGGFLALLLGPYVFGNLASLAGTDRFAEGGLFGTQILEVWGTLPGLLISVVFAALFMGESIPSPKRAARLLGPQLSLGVTFASGQYVFGLALAVLVLVPLFGMTPMAGALIEIGFEGGHGTAAGMAPVMNELGFTEGPDLALGMATIGIVSGIVIGIAAINWAVRTGRTEVISASTKLPDNELKGLYSKDDQPSAGQLTVRSSSVESMTLHVAFIALAILVGQVLLSALQWIESVTWADSVQVFEYVPLFPLAMLGGVIIQLVLDQTGKTHLIDRGSMMRIQGLALDLLIVSALASLSLKAIAANIGPFLLLAGVGIIWNVVVLFFLARR
ncbi:MAG: sodium:glutamate symporter, partial [Micrococcaceae bacterium]|nr:sodium:glutamate symporter [Micrococcaceae bacterium]